jgi:hypothetical protein
LGGGVGFKGMDDHRIDVMTYSGYRGEETPRSVLIRNEKIEVVAILSMWIEEGIENKVRKRFFKVKGSDGKTHKIYYDEKETAWFYAVED